MDADPFELPDGVALGEPVPGSRFGRLGLIASILGLILAVARPHVDDAAAPPAVPAKIGDQVVEAVDKFVGRMIVLAASRPSLL